MKFNNFFSSYFFSLTKKLLVITLFILLLSSSVLAIGAVRLDKEYSFNPNNQLSIDYTIINPASTPTTVHLSADENNTFSDYISFSENDFKIDSGAIHTVKVYLDFPSYDSLSNFGLQETWLRAEEITPLTAEGLFGVKTAVRTAIKVYVPSPGQFAEINSLKVPTVLLGENTAVFAGVKNRGTEKLSNIIMYVTITDHNDKTIKQVSFPGLTLQPDESRTVNKVIMTEKYPAGRYDVLAELFYKPGSSTTKKTHFFIGDVDLDLINYTSDVIAGKPNKLSFTVQSMWGSPLKNIRMNLRSKSSQQDLPLLDLTSFEKKNVDVYFEIPKTNASTYDATLHFDIPRSDGEMVKKDFPVTFNIVKEKNVKPIVETPAVTKSAGLSTTMLLYLIIGVVVLLVLLNTFILLRKSKK